MKIICLSIVAVLFFPCTLFGQGLSWDGTWVSVQRKENGTVTCALKKRGSKWTAHFDGLKKGNDFSFKVPCVLTKKGKEYSFEGDTKIGGDRYELTGSFSQEAFNAKYESKSGDKGSIKLKRSK
ncbi:MAG: hypothetical protein QF473_14060 [Planctomycetota bacterium]|jgi:hypothetical protein|nr:hypothetical protein [Planctomycetota bacterium]MDP6506399.1 hypothetical protein [Planctomycetota bacterium]